MTDRTQLKKHQRYAGVFWYESDTRSYKGRPDKCYYIMYRDPETKRLSKVKIGWAGDGFTPEIAQKKRTDSLEGLREQELEQAPAAITLDALAAQYMPWAEANKKDLGYQDRSRYKNHLQKHLGKKLLAEITLKDLEDLRTKLTRKIAPQTVAHVFKLVKAMYNKAIAWNLYDGKNPVIGLKTKPLNNSRVRYLSREEAASLLEALVPYPQVRDMALLSLNAGLRFGEIAHLQWQDVNFANETALIRDGKGGTDRHAQIKGPALAMLKRLRGELSAPAGLVFPNTLNEPYCAIPHPYQRTVDALGLNVTSTDAKDKVVFHTLRHTFASWLAIQGTPLYTIQRLMGHKSIKMTERYAHLCPDVQATAVETMLAG